MRSTDDHRPTVRRASLRSAVPVLTVNLCCVAGMEHPPEVHNPLADTPKAREHAVVSALFTERAPAPDSVPLTSGGTLLAAPRLMNDLFHEHLLGGTGLTFGKGLSPFSVACEGHSEMAKVNRVTLQSLTVELDKGAQLLSQLSELAQG